MEPSLSTHKVYVKGEECMIYSSLWESFTIDLGYDFGDLIGEKQVWELPDEITWTVEDIIRIDKMISEYLKFVLYPERIVSAFMSEINARHYPQDEHWLILKAFYDMRMAHKWVYRKHDKTPYYTHPLLAAYISMRMHGDSSDVIVQLLHDCIEDTDFGYRDINSAYWKEIADRVMSLSKKDSSWEMLHKNDEEYFKFLKENNLLNDKFCDRFANLLSLFYSPKEFQEMYITKTRKYIKFLEEDNYHLSVVLEIAIDLIENVFKISEEESLRIEYLKNIQK